MRASIGIKGWPRRPAASDIALPFALAQAIAAHVLEVHRESRAEVAGVREGPLSIEHLRRYVAYARRSASSSPPSLSPSLSATPCPDVLPTR